MDAKDAIVNYITERLYDGIYSNRDLLFNSPNGDIIFIPITRFTWAAVKVGFVPNCDIPTRDICIYLERRIAKEPDEDDKSFFYTVMYGISLTVLSDVMPDKDTVDKDQLHHMTEAMYERSADHLRGMKVRVHCFDRCDPDIITNAINRSNRIQIPMEMIDLVSMKGKSTSEEADVLYIHKLKFLAECNGIIDYMDSRGELKMKFSGEKWGFENPIKYINWIGVR